MELNNKATYDNVCFENHEKSNGDIHVEPSSLPENHEKSNGEIPVEPSSPPVEFSVPIKAEIMPETSQKPTDWDVSML